MAIVVPEGRHLAELLPQEEESEILWTPEKNDDWQVRKFRILHAGAGVMKKSGVVNSGIKDGDIVLHKGVCREMLVEGREMLLIQERDILALVEDYDEEDS